MSHETPAEDKTTRDKFDELTNKWIESSIKAFDLNLLKRSLEKLLTEESMEELENAHSQAQDFMTNELRNKMQELRTKYRLNEQMERFDELIKNAKNKPPIEKRVLPAPEQIVSSIIHEAKENELMRLQQEYDDIKAKNCELMDQLIIQKKEFRDQIQHIQDTINEAERGCEVASNIPVSEMIELTEKMKHLKNS
ncbi:hypothetical protein CU097_011826 [Rhizopus azygosporus]|uniref:Uncharacterized protein n=1 Tax=Rhizopus azygosporus TaxID=86630 RepID=A0A367JZA5_RHIAZ|nr:hypothetical protein CU097_011826 [Rhizopus azygosporus]